ncbi:NAD-dependent epimerase/dehydratase family protein [Natrinema sp. SYSU A 869]|uniref:NAD-dependent epimerase/dehydratase family protein n=1 Tax=Natrinema sp. SYSU A 869 TaxID=2871694 RepID=UPI001CA45181|nr:NAD-dependent epimerase/dehydratase family protein [Natrinema sp. SYSU A 869]
MANATVLAIGGTGFVGRHTVAELRDHGYDVTTLTRGTHGFQFPDQLDVDHIAGDRTDDETLVDAARQVEPDIVVDCAAYYPADVRMATEIFADVDAYIYVSSGGVYSRQEIPKREDETPLHECTPEQATDDSMNTYGPRKAECDRLTRAAADDGVTAMSVRPSVVYGPQTIPDDDDSRTASETTLTDDIPATWADEDWAGLQTHHDYWIDRVNRYDRVIVPGDGTAIWHRAYVEDIASAIRVVAERGESGEAYNAADRRVCTLEDVIGLIADALDTSVEVVHASRRELAQTGLTPNDFVLYHHPQTEYPHVLDTCKLPSLGWESTPPDVAMERTVTESIASDRDGSAHDPGRDAEERLLETLAG